MSTKDRSPLPSGVADLVAELGGAGRLHSTGSFTLDRDVAREKMAKFQLADPHSYVLELVQAAHLKGARRMDFRIDTNDTHARFYGRPFTLGQLERLYDAVLNDTHTADEKAQRLLALGLHTALGLKPKYILVASGNGERGSRLELRPGAEDRLLELDSPVQGTTIHVRTSLGRTLTRLGQDGRLPEEKVLRERCGYERMLVVLDGKQLADSTGPEEPAQQLRLDEGGLHVLATFRPGATTGRMHFVCRGVCIDHRPLPEIGRVSPEYSIVITSPNFETDLSLRSIVENDEYRRAVSVATRALHEVLAARGAP